MLLYLLRDKFLWVIQEKFFKNAKEKSYEYKADYLLKTYYGEAYRVPRKIPNYHGELITDTEISYVEYMLKNRKGE